MTLWNRAGIEPSQKLQLFSYENNPVIFYLIFYLIDEIYNHGA